MIETGSLQLLLVESLLHKIGEMDWAQKFIALWSLIVGPRWSDASDSCFPDFSVTMVCTIELPAKK